MTIWLTVFLLNIMICHIPLVFSNFQTNCEQCQYGLTPCGPGTMFWNQHTAGTNTLTRTCVVRAGNQYRLDIKHCLTGACTPCKSCSNGILINEIRTGFCNGTTNTPTICGSEKYRKKNYEYVWVVWNWDETTLRNQYTCKLKKSSKIDS